MNQWTTSVLIATVLVTIVESRCPKHVAKEPNVFYDDTVGCIWADVTVDYDTQENATLRCK